MFKQFKRVPLLLTVVTLFVFGLAPVAALAADGTVTGDKTISVDSISCDGELELAIELTGETGIAGDPADIMLVLDRSGSMQGTAIAQLKVAAKTFVDVIDEATDGALDGTIANGSRIGVVSFANSASLDQGLTSNATAVKNAIDGLSATGATAVGDGINLAQAQLASSDPAIMIVFTDGQNNTGANPNTAATNAKNAGTEVFAIGLGSVNVSNLQNWASPDPPQHVYLTPDPEDLVEIFEAIGAAIVVPAATNVQLVETVTDHFTILSGSISKGTLTSSSSSVTWEISELGTEVVVMTLTIRHDNTQPGGVEAVNQSIVYSDDEGHVVVFPNPIVNVRGCAALLSPTPPDAVNTVGDDHTVVATVLDNFDDPVAGITVEFAVASGPSSVDGETGEPVPNSGSGVTDGNGQAFFTYSNVQASGDVITVTVPTQPNVAVELEKVVGKTWKPIPAEIDIKPGSFPNSFGSKAKGNIPVAVLGSAVFDATAIADSSVRFGDAPDPIGDAAIFHKKGHFEDVNHDGYMDKVFHFPFADTNLDPTDSYGCLGGEVLGLDFMGCDSVNIVPK
jgi:uncharacterized protein YegL